MIPIRLLSCTARLPERGSSSSAAYDLFLDEESVIIHPGNTHYCLTGVQLALDLMAMKRTSPHGDVVDFFTARHTCALILPRSGLGCRGLRPGNTPGLIDPDYRGEIKVCLRNEGEETALLKRGDRIAQLLIIPFLAPGWMECAELPDTDRGEGGFGSTGGYYNDKLS